VGTLGRIGRPPKLGAGTRAAPYSDGVEHPVALVLGVVVAGAAGWFWRDLRGGLVSCAITRRWRARSVRS